MRICFSAGKHKAPAHAADGMAGILCRAVHEGASGVSRTDDNRIRVVPRKVPRISGDSGKPRSPKKTKERSNCTAVGKSAVESPFWHIVEVTRLGVLQIRTEPRGETPFEVSREHLPPVRPDPRSTTCRTSGGGPIDRRRVTGLLRRLPGLSALGRTGGVARISLTTR